jgi:hypothetical protein
MTPGHAPVCAECVYRTPDLSHPFPCRRVRWDGPNHRTPIMAESRCSEGYPFPGKYNTLAPTRRLDTLPG